jgi:ATP-dependent Clp protease adaptor protein ClpS
MILKQVFFYTDSKAEALMLQVHNNNSAVVGIYTYDIAITRTKKATRMARENSYPLRLTVEAE